MKQDVTLKDIYAIIQRMEDKFDQRFTKYEENLNTRLHSIEERTNMLETFKDNLTGKIAVIVIFIGFVASMLGDFVKDLLTNH